MLCQSLSLLSTPAFGAMLQQMSEFIVAALRLCQTKQFAAANKQLARVLQTILSQLSVAAPPDANIPAAKDCTAHSTAVSIEWSQWMDMLLYCYQLHGTQQLSPAEWQCAHSLLQGRDGRAMELWQRWKGRLALSEHRSVRSESEQYWLAGEVDGMSRVVQEADTADEVGFVAELQALLPQAAGEADVGGGQSAWEERYPRC